MSVCLPSVGALRLAPLESPRAEMQQGYWVERRVGLPTTYFSTIFCRLELRPSPGITPAASRATSRHVNSLYVVIPSKKFSWS